MGKWSIRNAIHNISVKCTCIDHFMAFAHTYPDNEQSKYPDTGLGKGSGNQTLDSERSNAERGHVQDSDHEKADTHQFLHAWMTTEISTDSATLHQHP